MTERARLTQKWSSMGMGSSAADSIAWKTLITSRAFRCSSLAFADRNKHAIFTISGLNFRAGPAAAESLE
eukprot:COSAG05_NODE_3372_length_2106_cov_2.549078_2_plen_70_part_00